MLAIVAHHLALHPLWDFSAIPESNAAIIGFFSSFGKIAVDIFFMITGYFAFRQEDIKPWKKIAQILRPVYFYSLLGILLICIFHLPVIKTVSDLLTALFPFTSGHYWFASEYILTFLLLPFLVKMLNALSKKSLLKLLATLISAYSIIWTANKFIGTNDWNAGFTGIDLPSGLYCVTVGYILKAFEHKLKTPWLLIGALTSIVATIIISSAWIDPQRILLSEHSLFTITAAGCILLLFARINISSKIINYLASLTFGVYLIHEYFAIKIIIWKNDFFNLQSAATQGPLYFIGYCILIILIVYISCSIIEAIRKLLSNALSKPCKKFYRRITQWSNA